MITNFLLNVIFYVVSLVLYPIRFLPDVSADSTVVSAISTAVTYIAVFNSILPIGTIFSVVTAVLAVELGIAVYKIIMWVIRRIPTQS